MSENKNIVITGGAGFIGSHLAETLLKLGANVICIDNFSTSTEKNIDSLLKHPNFEFLKLNVNEPLNLETLSELDKFKVKFNGVAEVYHLASPTSAKNFNQFREETLVANSTGTINALKLCLKYKAKFVLASSAVVYGGRREDKFKFNEEDLGWVDHLSPRACYDEGKRFSETATATFTQVHNLDAKIARIFRTYGPRERLFDGEMIPDFIVDALEGKDLVIYGDETFKTTLTYVSDIVDGLIKLMEAPADMGVVNLGSAEDIPIVEVAKRIVALANSKSKIIFKPPLLFMTPLGIPDARKAKEQLGWLPLVRLEDGLKKSIDFARAHKELL